MRPLVDRLSGSGARRKLLVFTWHNVLATDTSSAAGTPEREFRAQIDWLRAVFDVLPLREAVRRCAEGTLDGPTAALTFDDSYRSHGDIAARLLAERGMPASFYVTSGHLGDAMLWNDALVRFRTGASSAQWAALTALLAELRPELAGDARALAPGELERRVKYLSIAERDRVVALLSRTAGPRPEGTLMMRASDVIATHRAGFEIGGHTLRHPILALETSAEAERQIATDLEALAALLGHPIRSFAFPNGLPGLDYLPEHPEMLERGGIEVALTSAFGHLPPVHDSMQVPRVSLSGASAFGFLRTVRSAYATRARLLERPVTPVAHGGTRTRARGR